MSDVVLQVAQVLTGLLAGLYFAYAVSVMPALASFPDDTYAAVMNRINVVIVNPVFLVVFLGSPTASVAVLIWDRDPLAIAAAVLGVVALLVTAFFNIPLNNALAANSDRVAFHRAWVRWNVVRLLTGLAGLVCLLLV